VLYNKQCVAARRATSLNGLSRGRAFPFRVTPFVDGLPAFVVTFQFELEEAQLYPIDVKRSEECTSNRSLMWVAPMPIVGQQLHRFLSAVA
jgi:hypothetical protein